MGNIDPITAGVLKRLAEWWWRERPIRKWKTRRRERKGLPPLQEPSMGKQILQGGLTYVGLAVAAIAYGLDKFDLTTPVCAVAAIPGCNSTVAAGVIVGLAIAAYGRIRRDFRPAQPTE